MTNPFDPNWPCEKTTEQRLTALERQLSALRMTISDMAEALQLLLNESMNAELEKISRQTPTDP